MHQTVVLSLNRYAVKYIYMLTERYGIKNKWIKTISGSLHVKICLLHTTKVMLKKQKQATELNYKKGLIKLQSNSSCQIWYQASAKIWCATQLVQPNYYSLFDWTIQTVQWYDYIISLQWKWYITSRVSFLVTSSSHWYPHIICNKTENQFVQQEKF